MVYQKTQQLKGNIEKKISLTSDDYLILYSPIKIRKKRVKFIHQFLQTCTTHPRSLNSQCSCRERLKLLLSAYTKELLGAAVFPKNQCITDSMNLEYLYYCRKNSSFHHLLTVSSGFIHFLVLLLLNVLMLRARQPMQCLRFLSSISLFSLFHLVHFSINSSQQ